MLQKFFAKYADYLGLTGSTLCLVHCVATSSLALASTGMISLGLVHQEHEVAFHYIDLLWVLLSMASVYFAYKSTHSHSLRRMFLTFTVIFAISTFIKVFSHSPWIDYVSYIGSIGLIITHLTNLWRIRHVHTTPAANKEVVCCS